MDQRQHAQCFLPADVGLETGKVKNLFVRSVLEKLGRLAGICDTVLEALSWPECWWGKL